MKYSSKNKHPFENLADIVYDKLHDKQGFDWKCREYVSEIIDNAIGLVLYRLAADNADEEQLEAKIKKVNAALVAFTALFVQQLEYFSRGEDDGPMYDLIGKYATSEDHNDSGQSSEE